MIAAFKKLYGSTVVKNFSALTISNILVQGLSIFSSIKIARTLYPEDFGKYSFILVLFGIYNVIACLGIRNVMIRTIAIHPDQSRTIYRRSVLLRSIAFLPVVLIIFLYNNYFSKIVLDNTLLVLLCIQVYFLMWWDGVESVTYGHQKMNISASINLGATLLWVFVVLLLPRSLISIRSLIIVTIALQFGKSALMYLLVRRKKLLTGGSAEPGLTMQILKDSSSYYILMLFTLVSTQFPIIYLAQNAGDKEIAFYNIANRIIAPAQLLLLTLANSLFPSISRLYVSDQRRFSEVVNSVFLLVIYGGICFAFFLSLFSSEIIGLLYGDGYHKSAYVISIQAWYDVLYGAFCLFGTILGAVNKQRLLAKLSIIYALVSIPLLYTGSKYGSVGLSAAFFATAVINMTYHMYWIQKILPEKISYRDFFISCGLLVIFALISAFFFDFSLLQKIELFIVVGVLAALVGRNYFKKTFSPLIR
jgi:O-antigen/teichoic acid export membrane protein